MLRPLLLLGLAWLAWAVDPPVMLSPATARGTVGVRFAALLDASNSPSGFTAANLPPGLSLDGGGLISGQPWLAGTWNVTVGAANAGGAAPATTLTITVDAPGTGNVGNADLFRVSTGSACSVQLVSALVPPDFVATGLPFDLMLDASGLISGTPGTAGVIWVEVSADSDLTATTLSIAVRDPSVDAPLITLPVQPMAAAGAPFACLLSSLAAGPVTYSCSNLPAWLSLSSGLLSGTPGASDLSVNLLVSASSGAAAADSLLAIPISHPGAGAAVPASPAFLDATVGSGLGWLATASVTGAVFSALDPLPDGLDLQSGVLLGTPTTPGTANVRLVASVEILGVPTEVATTLAFRIADLTVGAPQIATVVPPSLTVLAPCALVVTTSVGTATAFTLNGPAGWTIDHTGLLTATPAAAGIVSLRVTASNAAHQSSVTTILAQINASDADAPLPAAPVVLYATVDSPFTSVLRASPIATSWTALGLPGEFLLTSNLGLLSGTPGMAGDANLQLMALGSGGGNATNAVLRVATRPLAAPVFTSAGPWYLSQGQPARLALTASGATTWSVSGLPAGLALASGIISGTPTAAGSADLILTALAGASSATTTAALFVTAPPAGTPVFTDPGLLSGLVGTPFLATLVAAGTNLGYTAAPLPAGLTLDGGTGTLSGLPSAAGTTTVQVTAQNASGTVQTLVVIRISPAAGATEPAVAGVSGGGCGAGAAAGLLLLFGGLSLWRRRR